MYGRIGLIGLLMLGSAALYTHSAKVYSQDIGKEETKVNESLQGKWFLQYRELDGERSYYPDGVFKLFTDDRMMQIYSPVASTDNPGPGLVVNRYYQIDLKKDPATVDVWRNEDGTDAPRKGILRLKNDTLTVCWAVKNKPRPTKFATGTGDGEGKLLETYKRSVDGR